MVLKEYFNFVLIMNILRKGEIHMFNWRHAAPLKARHTLSEYTAA